MLECLLLSAAGRESNEGRWMYLMKRVGVALLVVIAISVLAFRTFFPNYSYRYRLQLELELDEKIYRGSSVIEVNWACGPKRTDAARCVATIAGQAAAIDLGTRGILLATLRPGERNIPASQLGVDAVFLCAEAFGNHSSDNELPALSRLTGRRKLSPENFPYLVWFPNPANPKSVRKLTLGNISNAIDPTAHFTEAFVEITADPIVIDIATKLPWFPALLREQKGKLLISPPTQLQLIYNMFVGEDS